jgi:hypothetical protein
MHCALAMMLTLFKPTHLGIWPDGGASSLLHCCLIHCCCWDKASVAWQVAACASGALVQVPASSNATTCWQPTSSSSRLQEASHHMQDIASSCALHA